MPNKWRRFEVLLPLQFNDARDVPPEWLADAVLEVVDYFGAASYETQKVEGQWRSGGVLYRDTLVKVVVDVPDTPENRQWMKDSSGHCRRRTEMLSESLWFHPPFSFGTPWRAFPAVVYSSVCSGPGKLPCRTSSRYRVTASKTVRFNSA